MAAVLVFLVFLAAIALSVPIGISMVLGSAAPIFLLEKGGSIVQLLNNTYSGANSTPILAVPLFILGGVLMAKGGISKRLFNFFSYFAGRLPGGLPCAVIMTCLFYGAISGSGPATAAAVGSMCVPFLTELGYDKKWSAGLIAVAGGLGVIIPPSIPFVLYSLATGVSTGDLFLGGIIPGLLVGLCLMIYAVIYCVRNGEDHMLINKRMDELKQKGFLRLFLDSFWALLCPVIVLGGIYSGFFTPTEAATVSVFYALIVSLFIYKSIKLKELIPFLCESVKTYGGLAFVLAFATAFGRVLSLTKANKAVEEFILSNFHSAFSVLTVLVVIFLVLGMVMDTGPAIIILAPVLLPAVKALGVNPVHFGVVLVCCLSIGLATPPFGLNLFVAGNIAEEPPMSVAKKAVPFIAAFLAALVMITYIEPLSTFLPAAGSGSAAETVVQDDREQIYNEVEDYAHLEPVELIGADSTGKGAAGQIFGELVSSKVSEITGGQLTIDYHPNGDLGGDEDLLRQMQANDIQIVVCQTAPVVSFVPEMGVFDLPMAFAKYDGDTIDAVLNGEDSLFRQKLGEAYEAADYHLLGILQNATYRLTTANVELNTLADFKGLQIRTMSNNNHMAFWTAIGAEPTPLAWGEVYFALQSGTIDAEENASDTVVGANFNEVQSVLACTNHILYANQICINKEAYESLDPAYQQALDQAVAEALDEMRPQLTDIDLMNKGILEEKGMTIIQYENDFFDEVLALESVQTLCEEIDRQVGGLGQVLQDSLEAAAP